MELVSGERAQIRSLSFAGSPDAMDVSFTITVSSLCVRIGWRRWHLHPKVVPTFAHEGNSLWQAHYGDNYGRLKLKVFKGCSLASIHIRFCKISTS
jgi:hypothetical protein